MKYLLSIILILAGLVAISASADTLAEGPFIVDYHPDDKQAAEDGLRYLVEAREEFEPLLPFGNEAITMRIAHDMNEFLGLTGIYAHVGVNGVTRADRNAIAVKSPRLRSIEDDFRGTVRHELIHVLLYRNTDTENLPRWLNEGICMMLANEIRWQSTIQVARMHLTGQIIPPSALDQAFRAPGSDRQFGDAYAQALSMTRALYSDLGEERFWAVVKAMREEPFDRAMVSAGALDVETFWSGYTGSLWGVTIITTLRTGSFWGLIAVLSIVAFLVRWWKNRRIVRRWEDEDDPLAPEVFDWDRILDDADSWKRGTGGGA